MFYSYDNLTFAVFNFYVGVYVYINIYISDTIIDKKISKFIV